MALLETAIFFQGENLIEQSYYLNKYDKIFDEKQKNSLFDAISSLASNAFGDNINSFSMGEHIVYLSTKTIEIPNKSDDSKLSIPIVMYCIAEKETNKKQLQERMEDALFQFINRFSYFDIINKDKEKFKDFSERFKKIFKGLIKTEEKEEIVTIKKEEEKIEMSRENYRNTSQSFGFQF